MWLGLIPLTGSGLVPDNKNLAHFAESGLLVVSLHFHNIFAGSGLNHMNQDQFYLDQQARFVEEYWLNLLLPGCSMGDRKSVV